MRHKVYISSAITKGDSIHNYSVASRAFRTLIEMGFAPLAPALTMTMPGAHQISHEDWLEADLPWVSVADAVLRLPGESIGAEIEVSLANKLGIPVLTTYAAIVDYFKYNHTRLLEETAV